MIPNRHDPPRQELAPMGAKRQRLIDECHELLDEIAEVDAELGRLAARRRVLVREVRVRRARFSRRLRHGPTRQPVPDGSARLPALRVGCEVLWGRRLRDTCVRILRAAGALSLPELHAQLHHHGFKVDSLNPVKALADAMAYELRKGRLRRPERGVYAPLGRTDGAVEALRTPCGVLDHLGEVIAPRAA